jgi:hypothetical protein
MEGFQHFLHFSLQMDSDFRRGSEFKPICLNRNLICFCRKLGEQSPYKTLVQYAHAIPDKNLERHSQSPSMHSFTETELAKAIAASWNRDTSDDPQRWSYSNPARGQCAVTALIVQDFFGGDLLCANINLTQHYWNLLPGRSELDLTKGQFKEVAISGVPIKSTRQFVLSFSTTRRNYKRLRRLVLAMLHTRV